MKKFLLVIFILGITGCNDTSTEPVTTETAVDTSAYNQKITAPKEQVNLLPEARELTRDWLAYITAESEIENLKNYTVSEVISNSTPIAEIMSSLRETPPERFKVTPVETRLAVLYTKAKVLEQKSRKRNTDPDEIAAIAEEIPVEFNNLKIQLNELFLKTLEEFEDELDLLDPEEEFNNRSNPVAIDTIAN